MDQLKFTDVIAYEVSFGVFDKSTHVVFYACTVIQSFS